MRKYFLIFLLFLISISLVVKQQANAVTVTPTSTNLQQQITDLKNKIASKVAELNLVEKRGIMGSVIDHSDTRITLSDLDGNTRLVDVDELTNFFSLSSKPLGISDIKNNTMLGVLGLYNKQSRRILAREINEIPTPQKIIYGGIGFIDKDNFEITVVLENEQKIVVIIENTTKTLSYSANTLSRSGFSKMQKAETVIITGFPDKKDPNKISATRVILFPEIDSTLRINLGSMINPVNLPSTGSAVKR